MQKLPVFIYLMLIFSQNLLANEINLTQSNILFGWAEQEYPQYFSPANRETFPIDQYLTRYYEETNNYLGTSGDDVYVYGDIWDGLLLVGKISDFIDIEQPPIPLSPDQLTAKKMLGKWSFEITTGKFAGTVKYYTFTSPLKESEKYVTIEGTGESGKAIVDYFKKEQDFQLVDVFFTGSFLYLYEFNFIDKDTVTGFEYQLNSNFIGRRQAR